ncbi:MAG: hypothetical protein OSJ76_04735 [Alphaproteobacteria bacterium]|nr:hypothetical protein [Alphaproteobacteria bacterium]
MPQMPDMCKQLTNAEKRLYIQALAYVLGADDKDPKSKENYLLAQIADLGLPESALKQALAKGTEEQLIKNLPQIDCTRTKRYILREMILLALADHEITDKEVESLHNIGRSMGISDEKTNDFFIWAAQGVEWQLDGIKLVEEDL